MHEDTVVFVNTDKVDGSGLVVVFCKQCCDLLASTSSIVTSLVA